MPETASIDLVFQADVENAVLSQVALRRLCPGVSEGLEEFAAFFERLGKLWGKVCDYETHNERFGEWVRRARVSPEEALRLFSRAKLVGSVAGRDPIGEAHADLHMSLSAIARTYLTVRLRRDLLFGLSDLLRLRLTAATGYFRVQAETAALIMLMRTEPALAQEWFAVLTKSEGRRFYTSWHRRVVAAIADLGLDGFHSNAAEVSVHSRPAGVTRGILAGAKLAPAGEVRLSYQEVDDFRLLLFALGQYVHFHDELIRQIPRIYPEFQDSHLHELAAEHCHSFKKKLSERVLQVRQGLGPYGLQELLSGKPAQ